MTNMAIKQSCHRERVAGFGDDVIQDVFCRLLDRDRAVLKRLATLDSDAALAYLYTLIRRRLIDRIRRLNASCRRGDLTALPLVSASQTPAGPESSPERSLMVREARRQLRRALGRVARGRYPERESQVFELATVDGWRSPEIANAVHPKMSAGAVDVAVCRIRKRLEQDFFSEIGELARRSR